MIISRNSIESLDRYYIFLGKWLDLLRKSWERYRHMRKVPSYEKGTVIFRDLPQNWSFPNKTSFCNVVRLWTVMLLIPLTYWTLWFNGLDNCIACKSEWMWFNPNKIKHPNVILEFMFPKITSMTPYTIFLFFC